jgi:hypothetical protein
MPGCTKWGPEWGGDNGLSNHGPMAVEVLTRRGYDDRVGSWLDRYVARLDRIHRGGQILHAKFACLDVPESGEAIVISEAASPD